MTRRSTMELETELRVAQDYRRFLGEAEQLLNSAKHLSGDSAALLRQRLEDRVAQAKVGLENLRHAAAERYRASAEPEGSNKLLWGAGFAVVGLALAAYVYTRRS
jgi:ElaB/YqjD/DUF883 family membrane-anchored ribosome-binding protein